MKTMEITASGTHTGILTAGYAEWLTELKNKIRSVQIKAALAASGVLIDFYFDLGRMLSEKDAVWGSKLLEKVSADLKKEFPEMQGFSVTNLKYCRLLYTYIAIRPQAGDESTVAIGPQAGDPLANALHTPFYLALRQLPWGHIKLLIGKVKKSDDALFYINQTVQNGWSRDVLDLQIKSNLHARQGKALTNFKQTLPAPQSDLAQQTIKDPYTSGLLCEATVIAQ